MKTINISFHNNIPRTVFPFEIHIFLEIAPEFIGNLYRPVSECRITHIIRVSHFLSRLESVILFEKLFPFE